MALVAAFTSKSPGQLIPSSLWNSNFNALRDAFNGTALLLDTARTVSVTNIWSATQTFSGGWTAGAAATIDAGGLTITAGGLTVTAGTSRFTGGVIVSSGLTMLTGTLVAQDLSVFGTLTVNGVATVTAGVLALTLKGEGIGFWTQGVLRASFTTAGALLPQLDNTYSCGDNTHRWSNVYGVTGTFGTVAATTISGTPNFTGLPTFAAGLGTISSATITTLVSTTITPTTLAGNVNFTGTPTFAGSTTVTGTVNAATVTATTLNGTLGTAAQANVTSLGVLTALRVSGLLTTTGGNFWMGPQSVLATAATTGMIIIPGCSGTPTGVFALGNTGYPLLYDNTTRKLWLNDAGTWRYSPAFT